MFLFLYLYSLLLLYIEFLLIDGNLHGPGVLSILTLLKRSIIPRLTISEMLLKCPFWVGWRVVLGLLGGLWFARLVLCGDLVVLFYLLLGCLVLLACFCVLVWFGLEVVALGWFDVDSPFSFGFGVVLWSCCLFYCFVDCALACLCWVEFWLFGCVDISWLGCDVWWVFCMMLWVFVYDSAYWFICLDLGFAYMSWLYLMDIGGRLAV